MASFPAARARLASLGTVFLAAAAAAQPPAAGPARTLIHAGALIDGRSDTARREVTIVVEGERIADVVAGHRPAAAGESVLDLRQLTLMPGLFDMHVHLGTQLAPGAYIERFTQNPADIALTAAGHARVTLRAGFTSVRNLGDGYNTSVALRDAIRRGSVEGPRIYTAGKSLATTGGHADPSNGMADAFEGDPGPKEGVLNGPQEAYEAVRQRYKDGADLIKLTATGGVLSLSKNPDNPQFTEDELRAVVAAARDYDFTVAVHAHGAEGMKRAIRAGVSSIEHGTRLDDEVVRLMVEHGTYLVATLSAGRFVGEKANEPGFLPAIVRPKAAAIGAVGAQGFARAYKAGVKIAFGTDCGVSPHGDNAREFAYMVEAGMPAMKAIQAATLEAARLLKVDAELGSIEKGKLADLVGVRRDPLADVSVLQEVAFVMKGGALVKRP
jgi:imidazolonepropionase-like amidohydrolase